jgi:NADH-dependent peroxiredoxin subunit F
MYDLIIIGGGPAGAAAAVYASRKQLKTVIITREFGGQSTVSDGIENWIGEVKVSGADLAKKLEAHVEAYAGDFVDIKKGELAEKIEKKGGGENDGGGETDGDGVGGGVEGGGFSVQTNKDTYEGKAVLITSGSERRKLPAKGADEFEHKGLTYCATCDGPFFTDKEVAVIGGGNAALETVLQLLAYTKKVYLIHRREEFRADPITLKAAKNDPKLEMILNAEVTEIVGDKMVNGLKYVDTETGAESELAIGGVFVEIGAVPAIQFSNDLIKLSPENTIEIDPWTQRTSAEGIWAAGDVTNIRYHQNNIATGDAVKALEDIYTWIKSQD